MLEVRNLFKALNGNEILKNINLRFETGDVYEGKVVRIMNFGAFVEIAIGKEGLLHISQIAHHRVGKVEDELAIGDTVKVKVTEIDRQGRINLSRKALLEKPEAWPVDESPYKNEKKDQN